MKRTLLLLFTLLFAVINVWGQNNYLNEEFDDPLILSETNVDGAWYIDRYTPNFFDSYDLSGEGVLQIHISPNQSSANRGSQSGTFYNTQGRKFNQEGLNATIFKGDLYIPADWQTHHRRTDMWTTAFTNAGVPVPSYPIIGFRNIDGLTPTFSYWATGVGWVDLYEPPTYDTWYTFEMRLVNEVVYYYIDGTQVGSENAPNAAYYGNVIMQAYNFNDPALPPEQQDVSDYYAYWDNLRTETRVYNATQETFHPTIQAAVNAANAGDVILASDGTYNENVTINKNITLKSVNGAAVTIINGLNAGSELGTLQLTSGRNGVNIGAAGQGFTIKGIDGTPGLEKAAIYLQGTQSNINIVDNIIEARGDAGLMAEYNASNDNITITDNDFTGKTFNGDNPAGVGFNTQFTLPNVPRQLVVMGGGAGTTNTQNITFTNNTISGITGGLSITDNNGNPITPTPQGNTMVTLDLVGTNSITGNTFSGTTARYAEALRTRGAGTYTVTGNNFNGSYPVNMTAETSPISIGIARAAAAWTSNTFSKGVIVKDAGSSVKIFSIQRYIQAGIDIAAATDIVEVKPGTYEEYLNVNKSVSILGPNASISPNTGTRVAEAIIQPPVVSPVDHAMDFTATGITFTMKGMTIDMINPADESRFANQQSGAANTYTFEHNRFLNGTNCTNGSWWFTGTGTTLNFNLLDNYFTDGDVSNGISIWVEGTNNVNIQENVWVNNKAWAMNLNRVVGTIANNQFNDTDPISPSTNWYDNQNGFILAAPSNDIDIVNNTFTNNYSGINIYENVTGNLDINGNFFNNTITYGIKIRDLDNPASVILNISGNSITNTAIGGYGIMNLTAPQTQFSATCNWWGTTVESEVEALVQGDVVVLPWLMDGTDSQPATPGFQPADDNCYGGYPVWNQTTGEDFDNVQDAINDPETEVGDVIIVNGEHNVTTITVTKGLKIAAGKGGAKFNGLGTRAGEGFIVDLPEGESFILGDEPEELIVEGWTTGVLVATTNLGSVTIEGVKFQNNTTAVNNLSNVVVNAVNNYWGAPNGPLDASDDRPTGFYNPLGQGNPVSNKVEYSPWFTDFNLTSLPIDIAVYNPTCGILEVRIKSSQAVSANLTSLLFNVAWDATVYTGEVAIVGTPLLGINFIEYQQNGNTKYAVFGSNSNDVVTLTAGNELTILTLQLEQDEPKFTTTDFYVAQDAWVANPTNNAAYYIELFGGVYTGYNYWNSDDVYVASCDLELSAKVLLQGPYNTSTNTMTQEVIALSSFPMNQPFNVAPFNYGGTESIATKPANAVDWVLVGLRNDEGDLADDFRVAGLLHKDGTIRGVDGNLISIQNAALMPNTLYYAVVYHRNHMPVMSATAINIPNTGTFDFSVLTNGYKGTSTENPLITLETGVYGMIAGDHSDNTLYEPVLQQDNQLHDGKLKYSGGNNDRASVLRRIYKETTVPYINGIATGYFNQDFTLNSMVRYSGNLNDPRLVVLNLIELKGTNDLGAVYVSKVPGWATGGSKAGEIYNEGPLDLIVTETPEELLLNVRTSETIYEGLTDNIQFTLNWEEGAIEVENLLQSYQSDFLLAPQGEPVLHNGRMYQVFAMVEAIPLPYAFVQGDELTVMKFYKNAATGNVNGKVSVAQDSWTEANNGDYYISVWGSDNTGKILQNATGISDPDGSTALSVYPNPVSQGWAYVTLTPKATETLTLTLTDMSGRTVSEQAWSVTGGIDQTMTLNLDGLAKGTYILSVTGNAAQVRQRIVVR